MTENADAAFARAEQASPDLLAGLAELLNSAIERRWPFAVFKSRIVRWRLRHMAMPAPDGAQRLTEAVAAMGYAIRPCCPESGAT